MLLLNKNFNKPEPGMILETILRLLKVIFKSTLMTSEILKCFNKSGEGPFNWLLPMKKIKQSKLSKLSALNYVKSELLTVLDSFWNKSISLNKLSVLIVKVETMKLLRIVLE